MKKFCVSITLLLIVFSLPAFAQFKTTVDAGYQLPTGDLKSGLKSGVGGNITMDFSIPLSPVSIAVTAGYNKWNYKDGSLFKGYNFTAIPLMAGIRYYSSGSTVSPYFGGDIGFTITNTNVPSVNSNTNFSFSPILGLRLNLSPVGLVAIDVNARYWVITTQGSSTTWFGLNGGVAFSL